MSATILIVDDSPTARRQLRAVLAHDPHVQVVGEAGNGAEALQLVRTLAPQVVSLDVYLPQQDGIDVANEILKQVATQIVIVTAANAQDPQLVYRALAAGALEVWSKPPPPMAPDYEAYCARFCSLVRTLGATRPLSLRSRARRRLGPTPAATQQSSREAPITNRADELAVVLIGASTGGPGLIQRVLLALPKPYPWPIVVAQHLLSGFADGLATWLSDTTGFPVELVTRQVRLASNSVYLAANDSHILFRSATSVEQLARRPGERWSPSIDLTFESAALHVSPRSIAIVLTGMGRDGAAGMHALRQRGVFTIAQDPETCAVSSMPKAVLARSAAQETLGPDELIAYLSQRATLERGGSP
jgi:two-component system, chemotaxis family, protein-glutamate methylesterase/glutaminase